jgi:thymidylate synthase (FAD)
MKTHPMTLTLIARPQFIDNPRFARRDDQLQGPDCEKLCEVAGRICYDSFGRGRPSDAYHVNILDANHGSVLEHAQFSFLIGNVSRNLSHELVRHRVGIAISQRSTRYVDEGDFQFVSHPLDVDASAEDKASVESARAAYNRTVKRMVARGHDRKTARGAAARYLPHGIATELIWSANIRALRHVITMRGAKGVDREIQILAERLIEIMMIESPAYFADLEAGGES